MLFLPLLVVVMMPTAAALAGAERFERRSNLGQKFLLLLSFFPAQRSAECDRA